MFNMSVPRLDPWETPDITTIDSEKTSYASVKHPSGKLIDLMHCVCVYSSTTNNPTKLLFLLLPVLPLLNIMK